MTPKSGVLLLVSCVAAIAGVGSVFELAYGNPKFGELATALILIGSIPLTGYTFWEAVKDTRANFK
ncbi:hypothetical protein [Rubidibacter lacunae]|nr:hypothetical protein [Rubidibacter lacunae]